MEGIDFDDASKCWRQNKVSLGNGRFQYKCECEGCNESVYWYTTTNKYFKMFATDEDLRKQSHPDQHRFCDAHLSLH